jgi:hypothetical protein
VERGLERTFDLVLHHRLADKETMANKERLTNGKTKAAIL